MDAATAKPSSCVLPLATHAAAAVTAVTAAAVIAVTAAAVTAVTATAVMRARLQTAQLLTMPRVLTQTQQPF